MIVSLRDLIVLLLQDDDHPVKVGLSDAYIIDRTIYCKRQFPRKFDF